jgi:alpha-mannosidase
MLTAEWLARVEQWQKSLQSFVFRKLDTVSVEGFVTDRQLSPTEAARMRFKAMPPGTPWGAKWEYAWFRTAVRIPPSARGRRVVFFFGTPGTDGVGLLGAEARVLVNGREAGARDRCHPFITMTRNAKPGETFRILMEAYAGHPFAWEGGPVLHGTVKIPESPATQQVVPASSIGLWEEDAYQLWIDVTTLRETRDNLPADHLRVSEIDEGLRDFTLIADPELPWDEAIASFRAARKRLRPLLACRNGSTAPRLYCFGHSHIDVAWLWPLAETERKCARTFATQLALMEEYPEFKFLQSQPHLYTMTKRLYPGLYARIRAAVRRGQWIPEGGMWVEPDTNITGGESLIRQFLHGKRFFKEEFGVESRLMWLPDVFGYSGALPQIMAGCGIQYFSTQKIFWNYNNSDPFPHNTFWWEGIDGTRIFSHIHNDYNSETRPSALCRRWNERVQKNGLISRIVPFGWGDGGGGPTRDHLEFLRRTRDLEGVPRAEIASPLKFFEIESRRRKDWPVYVGELYYQCHRGTYTSQARTKRGNRFCEFALRDAELWGAAAAVLKHFRYPARTMDVAWRDLLLNQFHDIIPGSSIERVYQEAEALYALVLDTARSTAEAAASRFLRKQAGAITVFNSLSWERNALVPLPAAFRGAEGDGQPVPTQKVGSTTYAEACVPACGWTTLVRAPAAPPAANTLAVTTTRLENEHLRATLNTRGEISSLLDKATGRELAVTPMNSFRLYQDIPRDYDAWDIDSTYEFKPIPLKEPAVVEVVATGPLVGILRVRRKLNQSEMTQEIRLRRGSRRIEFHTRIQWAESHKLLKVNFPSTIHSDDALHEIQFGHLRRPNHSSRPFDADRFEVPNQKWTAVTESNRGFAVLNDCKYGVDVAGGSINLTLLRAPQAPDMHADQGEQVFTYALYFWNGSFMECDVVREGYELNVQPTLLPGAAGTASLMSVDAPNILIETVKPAVDGSGDVVVRLYESKRAATACILETTLPVKKAYVTDMLEEHPVNLPVRRGTLRLSFRPFEIKTVRLSFATFP